MTQLVLIIFAFQVKKATHNWIHVVHISGRILHGYSKSFHSSAFAQIPQICAIVQLREPVFHIKVILFFAWAQLYLS
jgi:hypothetical protein